MSGFKTEMQFQKRTFHLCFSLPSKYWIEYFCFHPNFKTIFFFQRKKGKKSRSNQKSEIIKQIKTLPLNCTNTIGTKVHLRTIPLGFTNMLFLITTLLIQFSCQCFLIFQFSVTKILQYVPVDMMVLNFSQLYWHY